jgi:FSR family fosmidomycin resistance protein-like MFS transporter
VAASLSLSAGERSKLVGLVSLGHFHSHFCAFAMPPLFPLLKDAFGIGYVELGTLAALYSVSGGLGQTPMGVLVDRFGGRVLLLAGITTQSIAFLLMGATDAYWQLAVLAVIAGLGNSVFHPADYAILAARIDKLRLGRAISVHSFSGYAGWALAPAVMLGIAGIADWRMALAAVGLAGLAITFLIVRRVGLVTHEIHRNRGERRQSARTWELLSSRPLLLMLLFFFVSTVAGSGLQTFGAITLMAQFGVGIAAANVAVTAFLVASAIGVLAGGWVADRSQRHAALTALAFVVMAVCTAVLPFRFLPLIAITALMAVAGFAYGITSPLRDIQVRAETPDGLVGVAFGFVSTGLGVGAAAAPLICGWIMDNVSPEFVFYAIAIVSLASVAVILAERKTTG